MGGGGGGIEDLTTNLNVNELLMSSLLCQTVPPFYDKFSAPSPSVMKN